MYGKGVSRTTITTSIPTEIWQDCKRRGLKWREVMISGHRSMTNPAPSVETVKGHTSKLEVLERAVAHYRAQYFEMRQRVAELENAQQKPKGAFLGGVLKHGSK